MIHTIVIIDFETTGLAQWEGLPIEQQPFVIQIGMIKVEKRGETLHAREHINEYVNPACTISSEITQLTGIRTMDVASCDTFDKHIPKIQDFLLGERYICGHNLMFDMRILWYNAFRYDAHHAIPYPPVCIDTSQLCENEYGETMKLNVLHARCGGDGTVRYHNAYEDCKATLDILNAHPHWWNRL